ncbi:MAG: hypothetical protein LBB72_01325 [Spirochaetaceae bacterium]|nr:hypothetical protein [Spirochaetaceae bacterium]
MKKNNKFRVNKKQVFNNVLCCDTCACRHNRTGSIISCYSDSGVKAFSQIRKCKGYKRDYKKTINYILSKESVKVFFIPLLVKLFAVFIVFILGLIVGLIVGAIRRN